ncbi:acylphosphatase-2 isoform X2 [Aplysia californica]|uniref:acylphosphatase n=1 Tax=Aplysia californica TaxID=6500 RepID=A0ABM0JUU9_APLCA|nr:acylphosphatase-2 isoform X2 [Aplysia californica]
MASVSLKSVNFEVFGRVQGVFFRKHTQSTAKKLGLMGWVENTNKGTVVGCVEGPGDKVSTMKKWLQETGSPKSRIEKCVFTEEKTIFTKSHSSFLVRK